MAINIPGLSLSILRQQTTVQAGLPLLISGRFTAFGMGVPAFIRIFLEGPSYDPQLRSFDTFSSPFSGDYSTNVIAEKDGQYSVYAQAFPPPLIPSGPPFPEAMMLLPPFAESTRPPLVVGYPFNGGVDALLPDGTRQRLTAPPMQPIEFRPIITVAPGVSVTAPGVPAAMIPYAPPAPPYPAAPPAPPPTPPEVPPALVRATIDDIRFFPEEIDPGVEATGLLYWRNIGDAPQLFDTAFYLVSPVGRYGPLQVDWAISAYPQVSNTQNLRLSTAGLPPGVYSVMVEIYDSTTGVLLTAMTLPSRLSIREIAPPVVPEPPLPVVPGVPTIDILGTPRLFLPSQLNVGDVWRGSFGLPTLSPVPLYVETQLVLRDPWGYESIVGQGGRTVQPYETLQIPVNYDTRDLDAGNYTILLRVFDQAGLQIAEFPMGFLSLLEAIVPPLPPVPGIPTAPTLPTADMFATPFVYLPTEVEIGEIWSGNISLPTQVPFALQELPSLPSFPVDVGLQLQSPTGQLFNVGGSIHTFVPGQPINLPVNFDTGVLTEEGMYNLILNISDLQGNPLFSNVIGSLRALMPALPPGIPTPPALAGAISIMQLEYNGARGTIPVSNVPRGERGLVHIWGKNLAPTAQQLGIRWQVTDPDGLLAEDYSTWEWPPYAGAGRDKEFIGGRFPLDKTGNYTISVSLLMNRVAPIIVGSYTGSLCDVVEVPGVPPGVPPVVPPVVPPEGTINRMQLEYNGTSRRIPASDVPYGKRGLVHIWGRNDTSIRQDLGIHWQVRNPLGSLVDDHEDWSYGHGPGDDHEFIGGRFDLDKGGNYTIAITLFMNPEAPIIVDSYTGTLCTIGLPQGTIYFKRLEYNGTHGTVPVSNVPLGKRGLVHISGRNASSISQDLGIQWQVRNPLGSLIENYEDWSFGHGPGDLHEFIGGRFDLDKSGTYTIAVSLLMNPESPVVVASYTGTLCTIGPAPPPPVVPPPAPTPPPPGPVRYSLSTSVNPIGGGYVSPESGTWEEGYPLTIRAFPYAGYEFSHWSGDASGIDPTTTVILNRDKRIVADFVRVEVPPTGFTLTTSADPAGYVQKDPDLPRYNPGDQVELTAYLHPWAIGKNIFFDHWEGDVSGTWGNVWIVMDSDKTVIARFRQL